MREAYIVAGYRSAVGKAKKGGFRFYRPDDRRYISAPFVRRLVGIGRAFLRKATGPVPMPHGSTTDIGRAFLRKATGPVPMPHGSKTGIGRAFLRKATDPVPMPHRSATGLGRAFLRKVTGPVPMPHRSATVVCGETTYLCISPQPDLVEQWLPGNRIGSSQSMVRLGTLRTCRNALNRVKAEFSMGRIGG